MVLISESEVTVTDEAFSVLMMENYLETWKEDYETRDIQNHTKQKTTPYTDPYAGNKVYSGWKKEGIDRYTQLCIRISKQRENGLSKEIEIGFRSAMQEKYWKDKKRDSMDSIHEGEATDGSEQEHEIFYDDFASV